MGVHFFLVEVHPLFGDYYYAFMKALGYNNQPNFMFWQLLKKSDCPKDVNFALY